MAGSGHRLLPLTTSLHTNCLMSGRYRMIDYQLTTFERAGIGHKTFVLGHGAAEYASILFDSLPHSHFVLLNNPLYQTLNLDWSAWLVLSMHDEPIIYYESNLLLPPSLLKEVKNHPAEICVAVDSARKPAASNLRKLPSAQPAEIITEVRFLTDDAPGEFIALVKMNAAARRFVVEQLSTQSYEGEVQLYTILGRACRLFSTAWIDMAGRPWLRVDNPQALQHASLLAEEIVNA
ncbi:nucleotidyltransferase [Erwiniaceae bacterium BAC15a-03b]|uniref:Nucleotidyltransferase n=2 Tax=Winslowiella arboricola TaxID=2978220 RepID=A0A9J6PGD6_9GAMM|nr:nucleotidyltransferase [Winslowiella arboricola]MCU5777369.1 nucleotidyltransferase [Winslowiella arboricola]